VTTTGTESVQTYETAARLRGFGPLGLVAIAAVLSGSLAGPLAGALLVFVWARLSETPLQALGFTRPRSWTLTVVWGVAIGIGLKIGMKSVVMPLLGASPINVSYHSLMGNAAALPGMVATVIISAGFGEEVFFRGYIFERLSKLLGRSQPALAATVLLSVVLFALAHYYDQRLPGVAQAAVTGLVFGGIFAWRRQIWLVMVAHAAYDLVAVAMIYWNWEARVAHLLFR
jgi:hypothetical protein